MQTTAILITRKRGNSSNSLEFKGVYPFCNITEYHWNNLAKTRKSINKQASTHQHKCPAKGANSHPLEYKLF